MRKILTALCFALAFTASAAAEDQAYRLDPSRAQLGFSIRQFGVLVRSGSFSNIDATLVLDRDRPNQARVDVVVQAASLNAGPATDELLKALEVERYPTIRFVSTQVERRGPADARVHGFLTLHGVTRPIVLRAKLNDAAPLEFRGAGVFSRSAFGLTDWSLFGDRVVLTIEAPFSPMSPKTDDETTAHASAPAE